MLVNAKCTNCGGIIKVDESKDAWVCEHCNSPFIVEKAINNYNMVYNNTYNIESATFNIDEKEFEIKSGVLIKYNGNSKIVNIPNSVIIIGDDAFVKNGYYDLITMGDNVVDIGEAFKYCKNLKSVKLSKNIEIIKSYAFDSCERLEKIVIPAEIKKIEPRAFFRCFNLKQIIIEGKNTKIEPSAFALSCLTNVTLPVGFSTRNIFGGAYVNSRKPKYCQLCGNKIGLFESTCSNCQVTYWDKYLDNV